MGNLLAKEGVDPSDTQRAWDDLQKLNDEYAGLATDIALAAGGALPPPAGTAADILSLGKSLISADWGGALMDIIGFVPAIGDAAKAGKLANKANDIRKAIDTANSALARKFQQAKDAAAKYWDDIAKSKRAEYEAAIKNCKDQACRNAQAHLKGPQYKNTPKDKEGKGHWEGERGDSKWVPDDGPPVEYKNGFPDYSPHTYPGGEVEIPMRGDHDYDFDAADTAMRNKLGDPTWERPTDYTWHHKEDGVTMQLVPKNVHGTGDGASTPHMGGVSIQSGKQSDEF